MLAAVDTNPPPSNGALSPTDLGYEYLVLVVDDSATQRSALKRMISTGASYRIIEAADGLEGLLAAKANSPDLIITDCEMPRMNGLALAKALRNEKSALRHVPIIMLTARTPDEESRLNGLEVGVDEYLDKAGSQREVRARVQSLLRLRSAMKTIETQHKELQHEVQERERMEGQLRAMQKREAIGQLSAGVAHEVNSPLQFITDHMHFLKTAFEDYRTVLDAYGPLKEEPQVEDLVPELVQKITAAEEAADLVYLGEATAEAFETIQNGLGRVTTIVQALSDYSKGDQLEKTEININENIQTTLTIAQTQFGEGISVETELGTLPLVRCHGVDVNQALMNVLMNAVEAIRVADRGADGKVVVKSKAEGDEVVIEVVDNGCGISDEIMHRVFDPFFTTKEVGSGMGQGLPTAQGIIADEHGGKIELQTVVGTGTTASIRIPVSQ